MRDKLYDTDLAAPGELTGGQRWTPAARLEAVITTAAMDEASRSAWCREQTTVLGGSSVILPEWPPASAEFDPKRTFDRDAPTRLSAADRKLAARSSP